VSIANHQQFPLQTLQPDSKGGHRTYVSIVIMVMLDVIVTLGTQNKKEIDVHSMNERV
jgi:hypothetical protein